MPVPHPTCAQLQALLDREDTAETADLARLIEQHVATCIECESCEQALTTLIAGYRDDEPGISEALEQRLLQRLCIDKAA